ncbi:MAG: histone deacetylase [Candidatus Thorarchaeota archaeon]
MSNTKIAFIFHPKSKLHSQPFPRPHLESFESPLRVQMATTYLEKKKVLNAVQRVKAPRACMEDVLSVHSPYLYDTVRLMSDFGSGNVGDAAYASPDLLRSALLAVGGAKRAAEMVHNKEVHHSFSMMRPPGHHATVSTAGGLCYFNNIAIATKLLAKKSKGVRVSILDFDDHHGNGTSEIFYANPNVQYISIHEYDYETFGTGHYEEMGYGAGLGTNINIPLVDTTPDVSFRAAIDKVAIPAMRKFRPDIIGISAGFDSHYADPVGNMDIDTSTYWHIGQSVNSLVKKLGISGSFAVLEGGYNPFIIGPSIESFLVGLQGKTMPKLEDQIERVVHQQIVDTNENIIEEILETHSKFR